MDAELATAPNGTSLTDTERFNLAEAGNGLSPGRVEDVTLTAAVHHLTVTAIATAAVHLLTVTLTLTAAVHLPTSQAAAVEELFAEEDP